MRICNSDTALSLIPGTFAYNIKVKIEQRTAAPCDTLFSYKIIS